MYHPSSSYLSFFSCCAFSSSFFFFCFKGIPSTARLFISSSSLSVMAGRFISIMVAIAYKAQEEKQCYRQKYANEKSRFCSEKIHYLAETAYFCTVPLTDYITCINSVCIIYVISIASCDKAYRAVIIEYLCDTVGILLFFALYKSPESDNVALFRELISSISFEIIRSPFLKVGFIESDSTVQAGHIPADLPLPLFLSDENTRIGISSAKISTTHAITLKRSSKLFHNSKPRKPEASSLLIF